VYVVGAGINCPLVNSLAAGIDGLRGAAHPADLAKDCTSFLTAEIPEDIFSELNRSCAKSAVQPNLANRIAGQHGGRENELSLPARA